TKNLEKEGILVTELFAGDYKLDGSPYNPLDDGERGRLQEFVEHYYGMFVEKVARARSITTKAVRETKAGMFVPGDARRIGLSDGVLTFEEILARAASRSQSGNAGGTSAKKFGDPAMQKPASPLATNLERAISERAGLSGGRDAVIGQIARSANVPEQFVREVLSGDAPAVSAETVAAFETGLGLQRGALAGTPPAAPTPATAPAGGGQVIDFESARRQGRSEAEAERSKIDAEIVRLCGKARQPEKAADFIEKKMSTEAVRSALFDALAGGEEKNEVSGRTMPDSGTAQTNGSALEAAAKQLIDERSRRN
ncbi:MAG: S49 family peptidase, partial [Bdellovibrionota bacterium]